VSCDGHTIPETKQDYERAYMANHEITGFGIEGTTNHFPCPVCCMPDWYVVRVVDFGVPLEVRGAYVTDELPCDCCGRVFRFVGTRDASSTTMRLEMVSGDPVPDYLEGVIGTQVGVRRQL
jgi:hypothetical protein